MKEKASLMKPEALLWVDFETTGTDREVDEPLEVGLECTDVLGETSYGSYHHVIRPVELSLYDLSPLTFSMHSDNGLLFELVGGSPRDDARRTVENAVGEFVESLAQRFTLVPAGTNVDFDLAFLNRMGVDMGLLSYRKFDLTTLRYYLRFIDCPDDPYTGHHGSHRVRDCIKRDIQDYRWYRKLLKGAW